ncbi:MAG: 16S rRNA (uracil(1498)-N(3))-methyltransferase [Ruminococcaceae bacterium]|nr:16S rRNA (uracil(1498)-N(3))-methyltransferase [Oscillospiraceae bacterium]
MPRFFTPSENFEENRVRITGEDAYHIARALRMAVGDEITVLDMQGREHACRLLKIRDEECECEILSTKEGETESPVDITLYMGYPKGDKLELVIQKAVELGASRIVPFESSRCVKRPKQDKAEKQGARLSRIAEEAAKQCGRSKLAAVSQPMSFKAAIEDAKGSELALFCYEGDGTESLRSVISDKKAKSISVIVGCEGGFSKDEADEAIKEGLIPVNLGPRILRCETAPIYVLSCISYVYEL